MSVRILHNPRCSKSRATLQLLQDQGIEPDIQLYLENPPNAAELAKIISQLGISARDLLRRGEQEYKALGLNDPVLDDAEIINQMVAHPRLIERPIVLAGERAAIGRPPESVLDIL